MDRSKKMNIRQATMYIDYDIFFKESVIIYCPRLLHNPYTAESQLALSNFYQKCCEDFCYSSGEYPYFSVKDFRLETANDDNIDDIPHIFFVDLGWTSSMIREFKHDYKYTSTRLLPGWKGRLKMYKDELKENQKYINDIKQ
jgi:hypothetical protein